MAPDPLLGTAVRLGASLDALAALAAHVRVETEEIDADPQVRALLGQVAAELGAPGEVDPGAGAAVLGMVRAFLRQAEDIVGNPGRAGGWDTPDPALINGIGRLSMAVADAIRVAAETLPGLGEGLRDGAFLDVGTGAGWLSVAMARTRPGLRVVGIDIFEPALELARANLAGAGLDGRVELRQADVTELTEESVYDAIWLPLPFLPPAVVPAALEASLRALRPGGWLLAGTFAGPPDRLAQLLVDLRTVRSGGHPWRPAEIVKEIAAHGFADAAEIPRTWSAPVGLHVGRRA